MLYWALDLTGIPYRSLILANDIDEAWSKARKKFGDVLDVGKIQTVREAYGGFPYTKKLKRRVVEEHKFFYHATEKQKWERIKIEGLIPMPLYFRIQEATGLNEGIFLGSGPSILGTMVTGLAIIAFQEYPMLEVITIVSLRVTLPIDTILVEDPEFPGMTWAAGSWITDKRVPKENIKYLRERTIRRDEWD